MRTIEWVIGSMGNGSFERADSTNRSTRLFVIPGDDGDALLGDLVANIAEGESSGVEKPFTSCDPSTACRDRLSQPPEILRARRDVNHVARLSLRLLPFGSVIVPLPSRRMHLKPPSAVAATMSVVPSTAALAPADLDRAATAPRRRMKEHAAFFQIQLRPVCSKEKTVFAPMRVSVLSAAFNSARDFAPVRILSGACTLSLAFASFSAACGGETFTSLTTWTSVLSRKSAAVAASAANRPSANIALRFIFECGRECWYSRAERNAGVRAQLLREADFGRNPATDEEEHRHAHGEAVGDLFQNDGAPAVGDFAVDFHAAIDRAGMHDEHVGFCLREPRFVQAEEASCIRRCSGTWSCAGARAGCAGD